MDDPKGSDVVKQTEGTYHFMAPESCNPDIDEVRGKPLDVWSLGITLFALLYYKIPFTGSTEFLIMEAIRTQPLVIPEDRKVSPELLQILLSMTEKDPEKRITFAELLENEWFEEEIDEQDNKMMD